MDTAIVVTVPRPSAPASVMPTVKDPLPSVTAAVPNPLFALCAAATILTVSTPCVTTATDPHRILWPST